MMVGVYARSAHEDTGKTATIAVCLVIEWHDAFLIKQFMISGFDRDSKGKLLHW
jgi:hypothetical protein